MRVAPASARRDAGSRSVGCRTPVRRALVERSRLASTTCCHRGGAWRTSPRPVRAEIREESAAGGGAGSRSSIPRACVPLLQPVAVAVAVVVGCGSLAGVGGAVDSGDSATRFRPGASAAPELAGLTVRVTPPAYTKRKPQKLRDPVQVTVIAGSRVRIDSGRTRYAAWVATESEGIELRSRSGPTASSCR